LVLARIAFAIASCLACTAAGSNWTFLSPTGLFKLPGAVQGQHGACDCPYNH
jgi:hypothetical protein